VFVWRNIDGENDINNIDPQKITEYDGKNYQVIYFKPDAIISGEYRVNSAQAKYG
jgi:hypothetical protein